MHKIAPALLFCLGLWSTATRADTLFLDAGTIQGSVSDKNAPGSISVVSFDMTTFQKGAVDQQLTLVKDLDGATTGLIEAQTKGTLLPELTLTFVHATKPTMVLRLKQVKVLSVHMAGARGGALPTEELVLQAKSVEVQVNQFNGSGQPTGSSKTVLAPTK